MAFISRKSCSMALMIVAIFCMMSVVPVVAEDIGSSNLDNILLLTPSRGNLKAVTDELFMIHFDKPSTLDKSKSIFIHNDDGSVFEEIKLNSPSLIDAKPERVMFRSSKDLNLGKKYYITFSKNVFNEGSFINDTSWSFTCGQKLIEEHIVWKANNETYRLLISLPDSYAKSNKYYETVYITDGDYFNHGQYSEIADGYAKNELREMILVGVCYPSTDTIADVRQKRGRDLRENANTFFNFFIDDIIPFVDNKYRTKVGQNTLIGNSNGGFFAANAFLSYNTTNFPFRNIFSVAHLGLSPEKQANNILRDDIKDIDLNFFLATGDQDTKENIEQYGLLRNAIVAGYYPSLHFVARVYKGPHGEVSMTPALHDAFRLFLKKE